jgi:hypothetical protein
MHFKSTEYGVKDTYCTLIGTCRITPNSRVSPDYLSSFLERRSLLSLLSIKPPPSPTSQQRYTCEIIRFLNFPENLNSVLLSVCVSAEPRS